MGCVGFSQSVQAGLDLIMKDSGWGLSKIVRCWFLARFFQNPVHHDCQPYTNISLIIRSKDISFKQNTNIFLAFVTSNNLTTWHNKDLHVVIPDEFNLEASMNDFFHMYSLRNRQNREYWLLDISLFNSAIEAVEEGKLKYLPNLDLDGDLYLFEERGHLLKIWEFYEIHSNLPRQLLPYGTWNDISNELKITKNTKWIRRRDLKVR